VIVARPVVAVALLTTLTAVGAGLMVIGEADAPTGSPPGSATETENRGELLRRVDPPPAAPPAVALSTMDSTEREGRLRTGVLFRADWLRNGERWTVPPPARLVGWGIALDASRNAAVRLHLGTTSRPSALTVYGFTGALSDEGEPTADPEYEVDCDWDKIVKAAPACRLDPAPDGLQLSLGNLPAGVVRIAVTVAWLELQSTGVDQPVVYDTGTWLFTVRVR
jgi:hypothetical protein